MKTELTLNAGMIKEATCQLYDKIPHLQPADISDTLIHMLSAPPHVQVRSRLILITCASGVCTCKDKLKMSEEILSGLSISKHVIERSNLHNTIFAG